MDGNQPDKCDKMTARHAQPRRRTTVSMQLRLCMLCWYGCSMEKFR